MEITETYHLVFWPDDTNEVPTYDQLLSTLELATMYQQDPDSFAAKDRKIFEEWFATQDVKKFIAAARQAEQEQDYLDFLQEDFASDQKLFPLNKPRHDH